jgi:regulator of protease activity HflC (stomatin/prohibitin superfamily)
MTGPLMSSTESAAERRNELLQLIEDQIENGIYLTRTTQLEEEDPITKEKRRRNVAEIVKDKDGNVVRAAESPIKDFCIKTFNLTINEVRYDKEVEQQIQQQQQAIMAVRIAMANAQRAEQDARTVAEQGKADAARAKWEQEKENATIVAKAEGEKKQATLRAEAAKFYKEEQLLKAEADAGYRAKIMAADNALEKRLEAYVETQKIWAAAVANYKGNWVPAISSSGGGSGAGSGMQTLVDMLSLKTARELGIDAGLQPKK